MHQMSERIMEHTQYTMYVRSSSGQITIVVINFSNQPMCFQMCSVDISVDLELFGCNLFRGFSIPHQLRE